MATAAKIAALLATPAYWPALIKRVAPTIEHRAPLGNFEFSTVLDVGSNKGQFAYFAACQWPEAEIHCFEPLPEPGKRLKDLLGNRVTLHATALGAAVAVADLHVASRADSSSLLPLGSKQKDLFQMEEVGTVRVPVTRLDDVFPRGLKQQVLLKVDVQGFEYEVLQGAEKLLPIINVIYVEASFTELYAGQKLAADVSELLTAAGFSIHGTYNETYDNAGALVQADQVYINNASPANGTS